MDYAASELRRRAASSKHATQSRRLFSLAGVLDGMNRERRRGSAGWIGRRCATGVHRFNAEGPDGLKDIPQKLVRLH